MGLLPSTVWLIFFLQEDRQKPEPKGLILSTFLWGGLITFVTLQAQNFLNTAISAIGVVPYSPFFIFVMAGAEEFFKFLVVFLWVARRDDFDEPIDAMVYMIDAALGFATVENIASANRSVNGFELITLRFMGATLLHALSSGLVGYYWALGIKHKKNIAWSITAGLFIATILHASFNSLTLTLGPTILVTLFLLFAAFFVLSDFEKLKHPLMKASVLIPDAKSPNKTIISRGIRR